VFEWIYEAKDPSDVRCLICFILIFSPNLRTALEISSLAIFSGVVFLFSNARVASVFPSCLKSSFLATKSVSQLSSKSTALFSVEATKN
jgi:hypothetical protein